MGDVSRKSLVRTEIKDADKGQVDIVFAEFNKVDKDLDVTLPGAFEDGAKVPVSAYMHTSWEGKLPVGVGTIKQTPREAQASLQFFMDTPDGLATFTTVKNLHAAGLGEWSYGYDPAKFSFGEHEGQRVRFLEQQIVKEISPVLEGAGTNTRTLAAKGLNQGQNDGREGATMGHKGVMRPHETDVTERRWDPSDVTLNLGLAAGVAALRYVHAWADPAGDPEMKASYQFMHHNGLDGPANLRACLLGIAVLNGAKGATVPSDARLGVYAHLAAHLADADRVAPDLREGSGLLKLNDEALVVLADVGGLISKVTEVGASRALKGKSLTKTTKEILEWMDEELTALRVLLDTPDESMAREYIKMTARRLKGETKE